MIEIESQRYWLKTKEFWFSPHPFDVTGCDCVIFEAAKIEKHLPGFRMETTVTSVIDLTQDLDTIWKKMSKTSARNSIKRAQAKGVEVKVNEKYTEFQALNHAFRKKKGLSRDSDKTDALKHNAALFVAEYDGEMLCGQAYLMDDCTIQYTTGASKRLEVDKDTATLIGNANRLLFWEAILYAKAKGLHEFDLGGYYTGDRDKEKSRISAFKKSFGGDLVERYQYIKYYSRIYEFASYLARRFYYQNY